MNKNIKRENKENKAHMKDKWNKFMLRLLYSQEYKQIYKKTKLMK